jgi:GDP-L-fucose synthase
LYKVPKIVNVVSSCAYPTDELITYESGESQFEPREILDEESFFDGPPHETVACHGYAKRNLVLATEYFADQYGTPAICVCPTTLYGPGDSFDAKRTKVMGGMIKRFLQAKQEKAPSVTCWGSGSAKREFLYVEDACKYMALAADKYDSSYTVLNIGSGQEITVKELAEKVAKVVKYDGEILWDTSKPDGQLRKRLDTTRQKQILGDIELTPLEVGIQKTVDWCLQEKVI